MEHNVVCNGLVPQMFRQILKSGVASSAKRWMLTMERHYDRNATVKKQHDQPLEQPLQDNSKLVCFFLKIKLYDPSRRHFHSEKG